MAGSLIKVGIGKEDCTIQDDESYPGTFSRQGSLAVLTGLTEMPNLWKTHSSDINARYYNGGALTDVTIQAALTDIGTTDVRTLYIEPGTWAISTNSVTVPANITLKISPGAILTDDANNKSFTINGHLEAGMYQIFDFTTGTGAVTFGNGAVASVYPEWWGADPSGAADSANAFYVAINSLPSGSGKMTISPGIWNLSSDPSAGHTGSMYYDIAPGATFTGAGSSGVGGGFNAMIENLWLVTTGPYIKSFDYSVADRATSAFSVEALPETGAGVGSAVGISIGASTTGTIGSPYGVWGMNILATAKGTASNLVYGIEIDIARGAGTTSNVKGIQITGIGTLEVHTGLEIIHGVGLQYGITVGNSEIGISVTTFGTTYNPSVGLNVVAEVGKEAESCGIVVGRYAKTQAGTNLVVDQFVDGNNAIHIFRNTDAGAPSGNAIVLTNAANDDILMFMDVNGNITTDGYISASSVVLGSNLRATAAANSNAGELTLGSTTQATVGGAGAASSLPGDPLGYIKAYVGTTLVAIPYWAAA